MIGAFVAWVVFGVIIMIIGVSMGVLIRLTQGQIK